MAALTNIPDHQLTVSETIGFLTEERSRLSRTLTDGTLIIANSGATLGVAKLLGVTCCANDGIAAITSQRLGHRPFVCHYINTRTKHLRAVVATGNGQPNLNTGLIGRIAIPFPRDAEQRAIAAALSDVDALLGGLDRLIAKKRDVKQAAMQQAPHRPDSPPGLPRGVGAEAVGGLRHVPSEWSELPRGTSSRGASEVPPLRRHSRLYRFLPLTGGASKPSRYKGCTARSPA